MKHCAICGEDAAYGALVHKNCLKAQQEEIERLQIQLMDMQAARKAAFEITGGKELQHAIDYFSAYVSRCETFIGETSSIRYIDYKVALGVLQRDLDRLRSAEGEPLQA